MATKIYGPADNFNLQSSRVIPARIHRARDARTSGSPEMVIWGPGALRGEFFRVDDAADALVHVVTHYSDEVHINIGMGRDLTILDLATLIANVVDFKGQITMDPTKPDGTPRKF